MSDDRRGVLDLLDGYFVAFEAQRFDRSWLDATFTEDVVVEFPPGTHTGRAGLAEFHEHVASLWERTFHQTTNHVIRVDGDTATLRAKLAATHVHRPDDPGAHLHIGGIVEGTVVRNGEGWRFRHLALSLVWTQGDPPQPGR